MNGTLQNSQTARSGLNALLVACLLTVALSFVPLASVLLYPIRLFVTFVHESSHALVALATGGHVAEIVIQPDASGYTLVSQGIAPLIDTAGYIGATAYGAWLLALGRKPGRSGLALTVSAIIAGAATILYVRPWHNPFGFVWGIVIAGSLLVARARLKDSAAEMLAMFLGVQCALNALLDLHTLIFLSARFDGGPPTDAVLMSQVTGVPALVWAVLWAALAIAILWHGLRPYWAKAKPGLGPSRTT